MGQLQKMDENVGTELTQITDKEREIAAEAWTDVNLYCQYETAIPLWMDESLMLPR